MSAPVRVGKIRAYLEFIAAVLFYFVARSFAHNVAVGFSVTHGHP